MKRKMRKKERRRKRKMRRGSEGEEIDNSLSWWPPSLEHASPL